LPSNGLSAFYDLEQAGPMVLDTSTNGNHGTVTGGAVRAAGKVGYGYRYPADGACIRVPDAPTLSVRGGTAFTIIAWVSHGGTCAADRGIILNKEVQLEAGVNCSTSTLQSAVYTSTTAWTWRGTKALAPTTWQHVAVTWDGATVRHYVDGALANEYPLGGVLVDRPTGMGIGCRRVAADGIGSIDGPISSFIGTLDEVALYTRAWTAAEVQAYVAATR
jgi:hypothetical protein